jgi:hypothetical protein
MGHRQPTKHPKMNVDATVSIKGIKVGVTVVCCDADDLVSTCYDVARVSHLMYFSLIMEKYIMGRART